MVALFAFPGQTRERNADFTDNADKIKIKKSCLLICADLCRLRDLCPIRSSLSVMIADLKGRSGKPPRVKDLADQFKSGAFDEDAVEERETFNANNKHKQTQQIVKTALMRAEQQQVIDPATLTDGEVVQVFSLFCEVMVGEHIFLCVVRKTLRERSDTQVIVGDFVRFTKTEVKTDAGVVREGVVEVVQPRSTVLTRADSFKQIEQHPIVANAQQMLIVAAVLKPAVKWGLIDRMLIAAQAGGLKPILVLNKIDLVGDAEAGDLAFAREVMAHYQTLGVPTLETSITDHRGVPKLRALLRGQITVLAGHSGVGKSSLVNAVQSDLNLRVGEVSGFNEKGRHTTTSARRFPLQGGGAVVDTPGVKLFGLWRVTADNLDEFFPDVAAETAPAWRVESYERIKSSIETGPRS